ncbi:MAG: STAS domain-containing protein [Nitrospirae bacterium]|nr:STAS domain-containing protein [Nitrospirota bacterium]
MQEDVVQEISMDERDRSERKAFLEFTERDEAAIRGLDPLKTMQSARLLGARSILVGISPQIAQTLVHLGVDLSTITTGATIKTGLEIALRHLKEDKKADDGSGSKGEG